MDKSGLFDLDKYYELYYEKTYLFAKSYVSNQWVAEDIASDAWAKLWEMMEKKEIRHPVSFLFTIVKNKSIDYLRHETIRHETYTTISEMNSREFDIQISTVCGYDAGDINSEDITRIVNDTLNTLPGRTRDIFLMVHRQELSKEEIARRLNITPKGVEYHIAKVLKCLRVSLKGYLSVFYIFFIL